MIIEKSCRMCGEINQMVLTEAEGLQFDEWKYENKLIQDCFPSFNPMEREFLKTGYCPDCQSLFFGTDYKSDRIKKC